jgi:hypothetical protein
MDDLRTLRLRYNTAFEFHQELSREHARRAIEGDPPSVEELIQERRALEDLQTARRALLAALE